MALVICEDFEELPLYLTTNNPERVKFGPHYQGNWRLAGGQTGDDRVTGSHNRADFRDSKPGRIVSKSHPLTPPYCSIKESTHMSSPLLLADHVRWSGWALVGSQHRVPPCFGAITLN